MQSHASVFAYAEEADGSIVRHSCMLAAFTYVGIQEAGNHGREHEDRSFVNIVMVS